MSERKAFPHTGEDYSAFNEAKSYLEQRGFSVGKIEGRRPQVAVMLGEHDLKEWSKLDADALEYLHGFIEAKGNDFRRGNVTVVMRTDGPSAVLEAFFSEPTECEAQAKVEHRPLIVSGAVA